MITAWSSRVTSQVPLLLGVLVVAVLCAVGLSAGWPMWTLIPAVVLIALCSVHLSTVRLTIGPSVVFLGMGPWPWTGRRIERSDIRTVAPAWLSWPQAYGIGLPGWRWRLSRLTISAGPALRMELATHELIYVGVADPAAAMHVLHTENRSQ